MNRSRLITGLVIILVLVFPASAISSCCCASGFAAHSCVVTAVSSGSGCCDSSPEDGSCCTDDSPDALESSCACTIRPSTDAVVLTDSKDRDVFAIDVSRLDSAENAPDESIISSDPDRPSISHNQRQAVLCVWLN